MVRIKQSVFLFIIRNLFLIFLIACYSIVIAGNDECDPIKNKKALKLYDEAMEKLKSRPEEAYELLVSATQAEPDFVDAWYVLANINYDNTQKVPVDVNSFRKTDKAGKNVELYFGKVIEICPAYFDYESYYYLGKYYYNQQRFNNAKTNLASYISNNKKNQEKIAECREMLSNIDLYNKLINNPVPFNPKSIDGVSTKGDEFLPLISPDGEYAFYTRRYMKQEMGALAARDVDEFTYSKLISPPDNNAEIFDGGQAMANPFNQDGLDQGGIAITIDNQHLYLTICDFVKINNKPYKNCDIYESDNVNGKWTQPVNLGTNINGKNTWEGQPSISADGKVLYFASSREENNYGLIDIYCSKKDVTGKWLKAENLGPVINTAGNEKSPFIHTDSQTLYFSSDGHFGIGGYDIFYSRKDEKTGKWTEPVNIGFPINTEDDDLGFIVSTNGKKAYFSSNKFSGKGGYDIYSFDLYEKARPEEVMFIKGQLQDDKGDAITDAKVVVKSTQTAKVTEGMVDKNTGNYAVAVAVKKDEDLIMTVKKDGYAFTSQYIKPITTKIEQVTISSVQTKPLEARLDIPVKINFEVKPVEVGETIKLNDIYFATNSSQLTKESITVLENFLEFLEENPTMKIAIQGHTDNVGDDKANMALSNDRAKAVYDFLVFMDIAPSRMTYKGFGETKPIATNDTEEGRAKNRRTEFVITGK